MTPEPISTVYVTNPSHQSLSLYVYPPIVARQRFGKHVPAATNTHATIQELLALNIALDVSLDKTLDWKGMPEKAGKGDETFL
jgi:hypothetical protein